MKKYFKLATLIIVLCMCFAIIGCFGSKPKEEPKQQNQANTTQTTTTNATTKEENTNTTSNQNQISFDSLSSEYSERRNEGMRTGCRANLKNIGTACEFYACDHNGRYPTNLDLLKSENYMKILPKCLIEGTEYKFVSKFIKIDDNHAIDYYIIKCNCPKHELIFESNIGLLDAENLDGYPSVKEYYNSLKNGKIKMTDGQEIILTDDDLKELGFK